MGGSCDSGTDCALVGLSWQNYFSCIICKELCSFLSHTTSVFPPSTRSNGCTFATFRAADRPERRGRSHEQLPRSDWSTAGDEQSELCRHFGPEQFDRVHIPTQRRRKVHFHRPEVRRMIGYNRNVSLRFFVNRTRGFATLKNSKKRN